MTNVGPRAADLTARDFLEPAPSPGALRVETGDRICRREMRMLLRAAKTPEDAEAADELARTQFPHKCFYCAARFRTAAAAGGHTGRCPDRPTPAAADGADISQATITAAAAFSAIAAAHPAMAMGIAELLADVAHTLGARLP